MVLLLYAPVVALALLSVRAAFFENGAVHWDVEMVHEEDQTSFHALMLQERRGLRRFDPPQAAQHAHNFALAEAALVESRYSKRVLFARKAQQPVAKINLPHGNSR